MRPIVSSFGSANQTNPFVLPVIGPGPIEEATGNSVIVTNACASIGSQSETRAATAAMLVRRANCCMRFSSELRPIRSTERDVLRLAWACLHESGESPDFDQRATPLGIARQRRSRSGRFRFASRRWEGVLGPETADELALDPEEVHSTVPTLAKSL
jgi:hypothetical protein